jgi:hypothetical protein
MSRLAIAVPVLNGRHKKIRAYAKRLLRDAVRQWRITRHDNRPETRSRP